MDKMLAIKRSIALLITLIFVGTVGYATLLNVSAIEALYMTIITISTVGFESVAPMDESTMLFTVFIIIAGVGLAGYSLSAIVILVIDGKLQQIWKGKILGNRIAKLENHYIVCGCGDTGEVVIEQFLKESIDFIVIDDNLERIQELNEKGIMAVHGNATEEDVLLEARADKAKGLISAMPTDGDNIVTVLTARTLNKSLYIISRAIDKNAPQKLKRAGADNTLSMTTIGGRRMASLMLNPKIVSFLDVVTQVGDVEYSMDSVEILAGSNLENKTLIEAAIPKKTGLIIFAIKRANEQTIVNPSPDYRLTTGDTLIVLGTLSQLKKLILLAHQ